RDGAPEERAHGFPCSWKGERFRLVPQPNGKTLRLPWIGAGRLIARRRVACQSSSGGILAEWAAKGKWGTGSTRSRGRQQPLDGFPVGHAQCDAESLGLRRGVHDLGVEQALGIDQRFFRRAAGDGDRLAELGGGLHVVDAAADDAGRGQDGAVLALVPAVAHADGAAVLELNGSGNGARQGVGHGKPLYFSEQGWTRTSTNSTSPSLVLYGVMTGRNLPQHVS